MIFSKTLMRGALLVMAASLCLPPGVFAQDGQHTNPPHGHPGHKCATDMAHEESMANDPAYRARYETVMEEIRQMRTPAAKTSSPGSKFIIPTVVHVVWGGSNAGGADSISVEQVKSQMPVLFEDFRNKPWSKGYSPIGKDSEMEFSLATIDPQGNPTNGIVYHFDPALADHDRSSEELTLKTTYSWDKSRYFNVWLVADIGASSSGGSILGYARFPGTTTSRDGIVVLYNCWGTTGTVGGPGGGNIAGRTATHEVGHWLGLPHTFQGGCGNNCNTSGDLFCDTPPTSTANYGFPNARQNSCNSDQPDRPDNPRNYMDYSEDDALNHFSPQQVQRMTNVLNNAGLSQRFPHWQDANLFQTGTGPYKKPTADFVAIARTTTVTGEIQFKEYCRDAPQNLEWSFPGGTPATSTDANPIVTYNSPGTYDVELIASNSSGEADTLRMSDHITVLDSQRTLPFEETFEVFGPGLPVGWRVYNPDAGNQFLSKTWKKVAAGGGFGNSDLCARFKANSYPVLGARDGLIGPALDLRNETDIGLSFSVSYAPLFAQDVSIPTLFSDTLLVEVSTNGGRTWDVVYEKGGNDLSYDGDRVTQPFVQPSANEWRSDSVDLSAYAGEEYVLVRFTGISGNGNNIFLDDISIDNFKVDTTDLQAEAEPAIGYVEAFPNPTSGTLNLSSKLTRQSEVNIRVLDAAGRLVHTQTEVAPAGKQSWQIDLSNEADGLYSILMHAGKRTYTRRIIKR